MSDRPPLNLRILYNRLRHGCIAEQRGAAATSEGTSEGTTSS